MTREAKMSIASSSIQRGDRRNGPASFSKIEDRWETASASDLQARGAGRPANWGHLVKGAVPQLQGLPFPW